MTINLHNDLASSGWHSSIITTYSVDPTFYDMYIERRLRQHGVKNSILMADSAMLKMTLNAFPEGFTGAGSRYAVVPVSVKGAFHPKVHLRLGENKARLIMGSANATAAGWGRNQEVITRLNWKCNSSDVENDNAAMGPLIAKTYNYLTQWLRNTAGEAIRYKLQMIERQSPWLEEIDASTSPITLSDGSAVDIFCESGGSSPSILKQFSSLANQEKIKRLIVISPYWDANLRGFFDLRNALGNPTCLVALNPSKNSFPIEALRRGDNLKFIEINTKDSEKFVHAKIFIAETKTADHVLFGSTNCSDDALGHLKGLSRNAEVSAYRRLPPGSTIVSLGINISKVIKRSEILPPEPIPKATSKKDKYIPGGTIEISENTMSWWPPATPPPQGAEIVLNGISYKPREIAGEKWIAKCSSKLEYPLIARVRYHNGLLSDPVIVHFEMPLRKAAPGHIDPRLMAALKNAYGSDADLITLAENANFIFELPQRKKSSSFHNGKKVHIKSQERKVIKYTSEEEFRKAMAMKPGTGRSGRTNEDNPGFQDLFALITHRVTKNSQEEDQEEENDKALLAGDTEDDADPELNHDPNSDESESDELPKKNPHPNDNNKGDKPFTTEDAIRRRNHLVKALNSFDSMLHELKNDPSLITSRIAVQTVFVFKLMLYGLSHLQNVSDGAPLKLMTMSERGMGDERRYSFIYRAAWMLKNIWTGRDSIASYIRLNTNHTELPDDIFEFIVVSRWAIARVYLESKIDDIKMKILLPSKMTLSISRLGNETFAATDVMGKIDIKDERNSILQMESKLGYTTTQTEELMQILHNFAKSSIQNTGISRPKEPFK